MGDWSVDILTRDGGTTLHSDAPLRSAKCTWALGGDGSFEVGLRRKDILAAGDWSGGRRRILFNYLGDPQFAGFQTNLSRGGKPGDLQYSAAGLGLSAALSNRLIHDAYYVTDHAADIAWGLIGNAQAQAHGDEGFTLGTLHGTTPIRSRYYCEADKVYDGIAELAARAAGGFDWEVDGNGQFNTWAGGRGSDLSSSVDLYESNVIDWGPEEETTDLLTAVTAFGREGEGDCNQFFTTRINTGKADTFGRREDVISMDNVDELGELQDAADEILRQRNTAARRLHVAYIQGRGPWDWGDVWLGDIVKVHLEPVFGGTQDMRLIAVSVTLDPGRYAFIESDFEAVYE